MCVLELGGPQKMWRKKKYKSNGLIMLDARVWKRPISTFWIIFCLWKKKSFGKILILVRKHMRIFFFKSS